MAERLGEDKALKKKKTKKGQKKEEETKIKDENESTSSEHEEEAAVQEGNSDDVEMVEDKVKDEQKDLKADLEKDLEKDEGVAGAGGGSGSGPGDSIKAVKREIVRIYTKGTSTNTGLAPSSAYQDAPENSNPGSPEEFAETVSDFESKHVLVFLHTENSSSSTIEENMA